MSIFQKSVINKHLANLDSEVVEKAYQKFRENYNSAKIEEIKKLKEEQYQDGFLRDIFVDVFGYVLAPDENHNLSREFKNIADSKKADGAILKDGKAVAVIELKSTKTKDLKSVTEQAFGYKHNQPDCKYVIISNFQKLQFFIDYANEYEEFDLFNLQKDEFELLYLLLNSESIFSDLPLKLKTETKFHEEDISDKLYKDYSIFKRKLFENLIKNNLEHDKLTLFKKSQKLLDRFLFILFAEDSGLLPPNSITRIIDTFNKLEELDAYKPIYEIYKQYFGYMNIGRKGKTEADKIPAYNGGLFYPDELLDSLIIDDEILIADLLKLSEYDFNTEVDVNILGHIFEHSLNEIEEITAEIEGTATDKQKSKRKKDGVFYTPKYITQYIVEYTVGTLCKEKRKEFGIEEIEIDESYYKRTNAMGHVPLSQKGKSLFDKLNEYKEWLLTLKIVDPACGSGAFLNQALNFLITEHKSIDDIIAELTDTPLRLFDTEKSILENNLYGVDINEESVEIAKLSLWLRTARKDRKLSNLNSNIKCGNSLIDDPKVAGDKAFNWNEEFADIMQNGGFDVVIGNPPYVRHEVIKEYKPAFQNSFKTYLSTADLYVYFIELGIRVLKSKGILGFINPNKFIKASYGKNLKSFLSKLQIEQLIDFGELNVFQDAVTSPLILLVSNSNFINKTKYLQIKTLEGLDITVSVANEATSLKPDIFKQEIWNLISEEELSILDKVSENGTSIADNKELDIKRGLLTGLNEAFIINQETKNDIVKEHPKSANLIKEFIDGDDVRKYEIRSKNKHLISIPSGFTDLQSSFSTENDAWLWLKENYVGIANYLEQFEKKAKKRSDKGKYWWELRACDYYNLIEAPKIIYPEIAMSSRFAIDNDSIYLNKTIFLINSSSYALLSLLNSKLIWFYLMNTCASLGDPKNGGRLNMQRIYLETISLPNIFLSNDSQLEEVGKEIQSLYSSLSKKKNKFLNRVKDNFEIEKLSKKLDAFYNFDFKIFVAELKKQKVAISLTEQDEWEEYFNNYKTEINNLQSEIDKTDKEIDQMVYELYGLTDKEIRIVEGS